MSTLTRRALAAATAGAGALALTAAPSAAATGPTAASATTGPGASTQVTLTAASLRSITVDVSTLALDQCSAHDSSGAVIPTGSTLDFPNGGCKSSNAVTITNGAVGGHIFVVTSDATSDAVSTPWTPCLEAHTCTGTRSILPGPDQFAVQTAATRVVNQHYAFSDVTDRPTCDMAFDGPATSTNPAGCAAGPTQTSAEQIGMTGPAVATSPNTTWTFTVTWTAVP